MMPGHAPSQALVVVWRVTEFCDLGCGFCSYSRRLRRPRQAADASQVLAFGEVLGEYGRNYSREVLVSWLGGEPLRWPPLLDLSHTFRHDFGLRLGLTTNGTALESANVRGRLRQDFDQITVSLDGLGAMHDELRDSAGLYDRLRASISALNQMKAAHGRGPQLRVNTILMRDNVQAFEGLCRAVAGWGVEVLTFNALGGRDRPEFFLGHSLLPEQVAWFRRALPGIRERMARLGLEILGSQRYLDRIDSWAHESPLPVHDCGPGARFLFIDERGFAGPCSFTGQEYGVPINEIRSPDDLHLLPRRLAENRRAGMLDVCRDCPSTQVFGKFAPT